jgi:predicted CXXCH cytochrome family protein
MVTRPGGEGCYICHDNKKEEFQGKVINPPVAGGGCTDCHDPHQSSLKFQLKGLLSRTFVSAATTPISSSRPTFTLPSKGEIVSRATMRTPRLTKGCWHGLPRRSVFPATRIRKRGCRKNMFTNP